VSGHSHKCQNGPAGQTLPLCRDRPKPSPTRPSESTPDHQVPRRRVRRTVNHPEDHRSSQEPQSPRPRAPRKSERFCSTELTFLWSRRPAPRGEAGLARKSMRHLRHRLHRPRPAAYSRIGPNQDRSKDVMRKADCRHRTGLMRWPRRSLRGKCRSDERGESRRREHHRGLDDKGVVSGRACPEE
jgi:hypothetical protein